MCFCVLCMHVCMYVCLHISYKRVRLCVRAFCVCMSVPMGVVCPACVCMCLRGVSVLPWVCLCLRWVSVLRVYACAAVPMVDVCSRVYACAYVGCLFFLYKWRVQRNGCTD